MELEVSMLGPRMYLTCKPCMNQAYPNNTHVTLISIYSTWKVLSLLSILDVTRYHVPIQYINFQVLQIMHKYP